MNSLKKTLKALVGYVAYASGLQRILLRDRAVIIAFHRVADSAGKSSINCPPTVFAGLCRFFKKHFSVMTLSELLDRLSQGRPIGGALVITFDDGYKDNFEVAAPILRELGLPATFFVATNFIDSTTQTFWDAKDGVSSEWMTWADVAALRDMGFDIGGHTMNHANLAKISLDEAAREIAGCRQKLTEKLHLSVPHFAYPFGGRGNITPETTSLVASLGFGCCLSCHGGIVSSNDDAFALQREPINGWIASPYQYGFELLVRATGTRK